MAMAMIQVAQHAEFQTSVFNQSKYAAIRYQAIPLDLFSTDMLNEILKAFGEEPGQKPKETTERDFLINEIKANCNKRQWDCDSNFLLVIGLGRGQLIHGLKLAEPDKADMNEQEDRVRELIARSPNLLCILDTDIVAMIAQTYNISEPTVLRRQQSENGTILSNSEELQKLTELMRTLKTKLSKAKHINTIQARHIRKQETLHDQLCYEYDSLRNHMERLSVTPGSDKTERQSIHTLEFINNSTPQPSDNASVNSLQKQIKAKHKLMKRIKRKLKLSQTRNKHLEKLLSENSRRTEPLEDHASVQEDEVTSMTDESMTPRQQNRPSRPYKAWTLKMLNIQKYSPERSDIITHVERVAKILEEADVRPESQKIRLLVASFESEYDHYDRAIGNRKRRNFRKYCKQFVKITSDKVRTSSDRFMQCDRRRGEDILRFFFRLCDLFKSSKGLMGDDWQEDPVHTSHIYTKLYGSLYESEKTELERKLDRSLEQGTLTVTRLKREIVEINKKDVEAGRWMEIETETSGRHALLPLQTNDTPNREEDMTSIISDEHPEDTIMDINEFSTDSDE